ncbi:unnamed protein product [Cuscuta europaea]|uniref:Uncharacterized protein n=1 Tax=Cuscuta europaea TaxID=41803 RepID=A0A9P0ZLR9_CUSEU|nr:unnamed protein product [Cuscuta europaea]
MDHSYTSCFRHDRTSSIFHLRLLFTVLLFLKTIYKQPFILVHLFVNGKSPKPVINAGTSMEAEKRRSDGECIGKKAAKRMKAAGEGEIVKPLNSTLDVAAEAAEDEEVEEFYAILRRMHAAVKYFGKGGNKPLDLSFLRSDFADQTTNGVEDDTGLDPKADPVSDPHISPSIKS